MAEWLKAHAWKACLGETLTWVRIPLSPPYFWFFNNLLAWREHPPSIVVTQAGGSAGCEYRRRVWPESKLNCVGEVARRQGSPGCLTDQVGNENSTVGHCLRRVSFTTRSPGYATDDTVRCGYFCSRM